MKFVKKAKDLMPTRSLKYLLHSHLSGPEKERPLSTIHASALTKPEGFCPRYYALMDALERMPSARFTSAADHITWQMGRDQQDYLANLFADMGRLMGDWKCEGCGRLHLFCKRPDRCIQCKSKALKPEEVRFTSMVNSASCGVDLLVRAGAPKLTPVEVKTMAKEQFVQLSAPLSEHRTRTNLYLRIIEESDHPHKDEIDTEAAKIIYLCKGGYSVDPELKKWGLHDTYSPIKEYDVKRNDFKSEEYAKRAQAVHDYRAGTQGMPEGICTTAFTPRAKRCSCKAPCFSGDFPAENQWK